MPQPLAPALGHLADPPSSAPFDDIRLALLDDLVSLGGDEELHVGWSASWERAVDALVDRVLAVGREELEAAATGSRYPARRLATLLPSPEVRDRLRHRLLAEGMSLEALEGAATDAEGIRRRGAALETAWEGALRVARGERSGWRATAARVAAWRRPWRPLVICGAGASVAAVVVAAWLGGFLPAPGWFAPVIDAFWRISWP